MITQVCQGLLLYPVPQGEGMTRKHKYQEVRNIGGHDDNVPTIHLVVKVEKLKEKEM